MQGRKAYVISPSKNQIKQERHCELSHFLDLIDASGFDLQISAQWPSPDLLQEFNVVFLDCAMLSSRGFAQIKTLINTHGVSLILFNADEDIEIEKSAIKCGAFGCFYKEDKLENVLKGINVIKLGNKWFRRCAMEELVEELLEGKSINDNKADDSLQEACLQVLTKREQTIVKYIGQGAQNQEIADRLHISVNTVKTHVYSIFRKTNCRNRIELMTWSMQSLESA